MDGGNRNTVTGCRLLVNWQLNATEQYQAKIPRT